MKEGTFITSLDELKSLFTGEHETDTAECSVLFEGGFKSWKSIAYLGNGQWFVLNQIDESEQELTDEQLMDSAIGYAMPNNALVFEWF